MESAASRRRRAQTENDVSVERLRETISNPGSVKINVKGAFILDDEERAATHGRDDADGVHYEHKDIRLPHHTDVVSHVAVDVSLLCSLVLCDGSEC